MINRGLIFLFFVTLASASAEVTRIQIEQREVFAEGKRFGRTGTYESISGRLYFAVDPEDSVNERITDLPLAAKNENGRVEFWADFFLLQPVDLAKGNGRLLYDVHNRGNKLALWTFNEGERSNEPTSIKHAGNGFLFRQGYSLLWTGWNGDVAEDGTGRLLAGLPVAREKGGEPVIGKNYIEFSVDEKTYSRAFFESPWGSPKAYPSVSLDNKTATLTMRANRSHEAIEVPHDQWAFAKYQQDKVVASATSLYLVEGFKPGWIYELVYTARDPRVSGLGLAGLRDAVSFFRYGVSGNPTMGSLRHAYIFGISQSGRLIHHFMYEGLNVDEQKRAVFDAALIHVSGAGKGLFNSRFGMATVYGTYRRANLSPSDFFPFASTSQKDELSGRSGESLARLRNSGALPKVFFVQTATEYWSRAASLLHTDVLGNKDIDVDSNVRIYSIAGAQHLGGGKADKGICQYPRSPLRHRGPILRALLLALDAWVTDGAEPPASRYPRIDDGSLVDLEIFKQQFPKIKGVAIPPAYYQPWHLDLGRRWLNDGIADIVPAVAGKTYRTLVPAVDEDGNEVAGIILPDVKVPLASFMGWNLRDEKYGAGGQLAGLHGGYLEFPRDPKQGDPRRSILQRYPSRAIYLEKYADAVLDLQQQGFLVDEDAVKLLNEAASRNFWGK